MATELTNFLGVQVKDLATDPSFDSARLGLSADPTTGKLYKVTIEEWITLLTGLGVAYAGPADTDTDPGTPDNPVYYTASTEGTYTHFLDSSSTAIVLASGEALAILAYDGTSWTKQVVNLDLSGYATQADVGDINDKLNDSDTTFGALDDFSTYASNGSTTPLTLALVKHPIASDGSVETINMQCNAAGSIKINFWRLVSGTTYKCIANFIFTCVSGLNTFTAGTDFDAFDVKSGDFIGFTETGGATGKYKAVAGGAVYGSVTSFNVGDNVTLGSVSGGEYALSAGATVKGLSTTVSDNSEALTEAVLESDLTLVDSPNLAKNDYKILNVGIYNSQKNTASGWVCYRIPVTPGQVITFGNFSFSSGNYGQAAFYDNTDDPATMGTSGFISASSNYFNANIPVTLTVPDGAAWLYFDVARSGSTTDMYDKVMCNIGATLKDYVPSTQLVDGIKGYGLNGSGGSSDVENFSDLADVPAYSGNGGKGLKIKSTEDGLDTFAPVAEDTDVSFASVTATGLSVDLPSGATEPTGLSIGDAWIDTTDSTIKVKLS